MTNLITESTTNIVNELLDDIKENIIQINDDFEQIQLNTIKPINITNLLEKKLLNNDEHKEESHLLPTSSNGSTLETSESPIPLILMNKQIELIHSLEHQWSFWYLKNQQGKDWQDNLMKLATFGYVEEFWA
ncbi:unnamed protein product [Rotaria sp. Silwood1]|nr:unnamed protein product [Rotaria sp. Silwood1]